VAVFFGLALAVLAAGAAVVFLPRRYPDQLCLHAPRLLCHRLHLRLNHVHQKHRTLSGTFGLHLKRLVVLYSASGLLLPKDFRVWLEWNALITLASPEAVKPECWMAWSPDASWTTVACICAITAGVLLLLDWYRVEHIPLCGVAPKGRGSMALSQEPAQATPRDVVDKRAAAAQTFLDDLVCCICDDPCVEPCTPCQNPQHVFCLKHIKKWVIEKAGSATCPLCRGLITQHPQELRVNSNVFSDVERANAAIARAKAAKGADSAAIELGFGSSTDSSPGTSSDTLSGSSPDSLSGSSSDSLSGSSSSYESPSGSAAGSTPGPSPSPSALKDFCARLLTNNSIDYSTSLWSESFLNWTAGVFVPYAMRAVACRQGVDGRYFNYYDPGERGMCLAYPHFPIFVLSILFLIFYLAYLVHFFVVPVCAIYSPFFKAGLWHREGHHEHIRAGDATLKWRLLKNAIPALSSLIVLFPESQAGVLVFLWLLFCVEFVVAFSNGFFSSAHGLHAKPTYILYLLCTLVTLCIASSVARGEGSSGTGLAGLLVFINFFLVPFSVLLALLSLVCLNHNDDSIVYRVIVGTTATVPISIGCNPLVISNSWICLHPGCPAAKKNKLAINSDFDQRCWASVFGCKNTRWKVESPILPLRSRPLIIKAWHPQFEQFFYKPQHRALCCVHPPANLAEVLQTQGLLGSPSDTERARLLRGVKKPLILEENSAFEGSEQCPRCAKEGMSVRHVQGGAIQPHPQARVGFPPAQGGGGATQPQQSEPPRVGFPPQNIYGAL